MRSQTSTAMNTLLKYKKELILLITGIILGSIAIFGNLSPLLPTQAEITQAKPTPITDPSKDLISLDNSITYDLPNLWQKTDHIDPQGVNTYLKLTTPDFSAPEPSKVDSGIGVVINRTYDLNSENTLKDKLNAVYGFDIYNVTLLTLDGKNAMTMHKDGENVHARIIYIATKTHLWDITITSKSLEDAQRYQGEIDSLINSMIFN